MLLLFFVVAVVLVVAAAVIVSVICGIVVNGFRQIVAMRKKYECVVWQVLLLCLLRCCSEASRCQPPGRNEWRCLCLRVAHDVA